MNVGQVVSLLAFTIACVCALSLGHRVAHLTVSRTLVTLVLPASFVLLGALGLLYIFFSQHKSAEAAFVGALCSIAVGSVFAWFFITHSVSDEQARDTSERLAAASEQFSAQQEYCRTLELSKGSAANLKSENSKRFHEVAHVLRRGGRECRPSAITRERKVPRGTDIHALRKRGSCRAPINKARKMPWPRSHMAMRRRCARVHRALTAHALRGVLEHARQRNSGGSVEWS